MYNLALKNYNKKLRFSMSVAQKISFIDGGRSFVQTIHTKISNKFASICGVVTKNHFRHPNL